MDMQNVINAMNDTRKNESAKEYNLGRFIADRKKLDPDKYIYIENGVGCVGLNSWRGSYCELAMEYDENAKSKVKDVLKDAEETLGATLTGYKGGDFIMDKNTPIHIANYGETSFNIQKFEYEFQCSNPEDNFMTHYDVKLVGIEDKGEHYQLKIRIDDSDFEG